MRGVGNVMLVPEILARQARETPGATAVRTTDGELSYAGLNGGANRIARRLRQQGAGPEVAVGLELPRGLDLVTAVLGVLKAGAAYVPVDPTLPEERRRRMWAAVGARIVLSQPMADATGEWLDDEPGPVSLPENLAYVVFTSGSTGEPKPVAVSHRALHNHATAMARRYRIEPTDRVLQFASAGFDVFAEELFPTLLAGAELVLLPDPARTAPVELERFLDVHRISLVNVPTPYWVRWTHDLELAPRRLPSSLRLVVIGSASADTAALARWQRHTGVPVVNAYGLSETTITTCTAEFGHGELPAGETVPVRDPIPGTALLLLGIDGRPVAPGAVGEVYVAGAALARGYFGQPGPTAERFVAHDGGTRLSVPVIWAGGIWTADWNCSAAPTGSSKYGATAWTRPRSRAPF